MRVAIVGAGALGLYYGAKLQHSGAETGFLLRRDYDAIMTGGLDVKSVDGDFHLAEVTGFRDSREFGVTDLVVIGLKTFCNPEMNRLVQPLVGPGTVVLTLQNGLGNEEVLAEAFPPEQVMGGIAFLCANRGEPGTVHHLGQGAVRIGSFRGDRTAAGEQVAELFRSAGIACDHVDDLLKARWEKLVWNIPFNGLCALTGKTVTELLGHRPTRQLVTDIMAEVIAAANSMPISSPIDGPAFIDRMIAATETMDHYRPSMMIDRLNGQPLELDSIYRQPLERARQAGIGMPKTDILHTLLELGEPDIA